LTFNISENPRITLINPPYPKPVMRRYVASYFAPNFLLPPTDLLYVSSAAREFIGAQTTVLDCVARRYDIEKSVNATLESEPQLAFCQLGYATLEKDLEFIGRLKEVADIPIVAMGHLPTHFPKEILKRSSLDAVIRGEPEKAFCNLVEAWRLSQDPARVPGVACRINGEIVVGPDPEPIEDFNALPMADHGAVNADDYYEVLIGRSVAALFTARGCPYPCTFCVRTFGRRLSMRTAESVIEELRFIVEDQGVRNIRFLDDTFTVEEGRVFDICEGLKKLGPLQWTALARLDNITVKMIEAMADSGCKRLYVGMESGSQRMLDIYKKRLSLSDIHRGMRRIRQAGIETSAFFIVGGPTETREEFEASLALAHKTKTDFVIVTRLQYWPGTELFEKHKDELLVSLIPFAIHPKDKENYLKHMDLEREFYRRFYMRPAYMLRRLGKLILRPRDLVVSAVKLLRFVLGKGEQDFI